MARGRVIKSVEKARMLEEILLGVLGEVYTKIEAKQQFNISDDFMREVAKQDGKVIINNFQTQNISVENKKQLIKATQIVRDLRAELSMKVNREEISEQVKRDDLLYSKIFEEIKHFGSFTLFKKVVFQKITNLFFNNNKTHAAHFLGINERTLRNNFDTDLIKQIPDREIIEIEQIERQ